MQFRPHPRALVTLLAVAVALSPTGALDAQQPRPLTWADMQELRMVNSPALAPDGTRLLYSLEVPDWRRSASQSDVYLVSTVAGVPSTRRLTTTDDKREARPVWSPDGRYVIFASNADGPSQLYLMHPDSAAQRKFTSASAGVGTYEFSPDGRWLVYRSGRSAADQQLFALPADSLVHGDEPVARQLTRHSAGVGTWRWAPDGARIYFTAADATDSLERERQEARFNVQVQDPVTPLTGLWSVDVTSGAATHVVRDTALTVGDFSLSSDGRWLAFRALPSDRHKRNAGVEATMYGDNYLLEIVTGRIERLTNNEDIPETTPSFSPDSRWIAYGAGREGQGFTQNRRTYLRRVDDRGGQWRQLGADFDGDVGLDFWSPDSRTIYFDAGVGVTTQLFALDVASGRVRQLTNVRGVVSAIPQRDARHPFVMLYQDPLTPPSAYAARTVVDLADKTKWTRLTHANPQIDAIALGETSEITWTSPDGATVGGVLVKPVGYQQGRRYPLLVILHGGPHSAETFTFNGDDNDGPQVYAGTGYVVFAPNYRGSSNYGERFKRAIIGNYQGLAYADVMSGVDHLIATGLADSARMGVAGHSAGGTLGNWILTQTDRFKAISSGAGVANWISMYGTSDFQRPREEWFGGPPYGNFDAYWDQSPLKYVANARTPTLIYSTEGDPRVPSGQARELYTALRRLGVPAELHIYPGSQHGVPGARNRVAHGMMEMAWMDYYVRGSGRPFSWRDVLRTLQDSAQQVASAPPPAATQAAAASTPALTPTPTPTVDDSTLRSYVGQYDFGEGRAILVTLEDGQLFGQPSGQSKVPLVHDAGRAFFVGRTGSPIKVTFVVGPSGETTGMELLQNGNVRTGRRTR